MNKNYNENVKTITLKEVKKMYLNDTQNKPKNNTCNNAIIKLIELINNDNKTITCELTKGGSVLNRGSVVECLVKLYLTNQKTTSKYAQGRNDINLNGVGYEIKYYNSVAYASLSKKQQQQYNNKEYKPLIAVDSYGVYISNTQYYKIAKNGKISGISKRLGTIVEW